MELRPRLAPEMAVGELLIPPQWTVDVVHHFVTSSFVGPSSFHECLTPSKKLAKGYGCSSNTLRAESLDSLGDALYVTEWFVPICHCEGEAMWEANAMQAALEAMPPRRPARPVLQARVAEITTEDLIEVSQSAHDSTEDPLTPSTSIAAHLLSSHRIFIQVVLDVLEGPSDDMERITQRILRDTIRKFLAPLEVLPQFQWFFDGKGKGAGTAQSENAERHRCSGRTLVLGRSEPTFSTVLDCKQGGALIEIDTVAVGADPCSVRCGGTPASQALQNLAVDILQLNFDGLMLTLGERLHAVTTFPVCGIPRVCSTNSASIEMAFEQHCRLCLASAGWKMEKVASPQISISLPDVLADLRNVMERMEDWNGKQSTSERLSLETRRYSSVVPTRSTFYTFTFSPAPQQKTSAFDPHIGDGSDTSTAVAFLAQLFCPMVTSNSAIVMISPLLSTDNGRYIPQARSLFHLALGGVSEWSALRHEEGSGTLYRQGQLVLKVPATHPSMDGVVVTPTAALLFNSLGSLSVTSTSSGHAAWNTAVWTLRSDCRSASEYLDYVISEYAYNTQAYNLSNVSNRSACAHNNDHVFIRRKEKPAAPQKVLSKGPHRGLKVGETWSVWIDLGPKTSRRSVYTHASEVGLSQLLIIQAVLDYSQYPIGGGQSEEDVTTRLRAEREGQLVEWINAMPVATLSV